MSDLVNVRELPMHTKREVAVGHAFDVLNGKVESVMLDADAQPLDEAERNFYTIAPDTMLSVKTNAKEIRKVIESDFGFIQGRDVKLLINKLGNSTIGIAVCHLYDGHTSLADFKGSEVE